MMDNATLLDTLYASIGTNRHARCGDPEVARIEIHHNLILGVHLVPGLQVDATETKEGIEAKIVIEKGARIQKPIQICFGMIPETGIQEITLDIHAEEGSRAGIMAYCTFPNAVDIRHVMDARITIGKGAEYAYFERHVHGQNGGVNVVPHTKIHVQEGGRFQTDFELIKGRVGQIDIDLEVTGEAHSVSELKARISGAGEDRIQIRETGHLIGEYARAVLCSNIALRHQAQAQIFNTLTASAAYARGHVDCKEIVQDQAVAKAVPIVEVNHPKAHITHEAAIGSVDSRQLETLMSRGLDEDEAVDLIIQGLLSC
ncbi:MAG: SufD family Fe-S cluster assembly protein [bacterium]|jgi:Fe-S cluster assembly scaffold protein SufB|nr:SufD family Fe-S cluster assembly protein [bacterium]